MILNAPGQGSLFLRRGLFRSVSSVSRSIVHCLTQSQYYLQTVLFWHHLVLEGYVHSVVDEVFLPMPLTLSSELPQ
jgi:hypothetical protein